MVGSVNTNINAMAAIASLNSIGNQMQTTQGAIESGLKVGAASDNPAVFTIAQGLRGNVNALSAVSSSLATGIATVQGQTQGATSISNALTTLLQTITQAQNETGTALAASNSTITAALGNIDAYANATTINGVNLLATAGTLNVISNVNGSNTSITTNTASTSAGLGLTGLQVTAGQAISNTIFLTLTAAAAVGEAVTYTAANGVQTTYSFAAAAGNTGSNIIANGAAATNSAANLMAAINATAGSAVATMTGGTNVVTLTGGGTMTDSKTTNGTTTGGPAASAQYVFTSTGGTASTFTLTPTLTPVAGQVTLGANAAQTYANLATSMMAAGISASASNGVLTITGGTMTTLPGTATAVTANGGAYGIGLVNTALAQIGATLSSLGSTTVQLKGLADFTDQLSTSVTTSLGAMVDANLSEESAQLSSLQTKQSLAIQSLSLANQGPGALLQLFR